MADAVTVHYSPAALALLKANLGFFGSKVDPSVENYLTDLLGFAYEDFRDMGISLEPGKIRDDMLQVTHAAWMYRNGVKGAGKTAMLREMIRNRQVSDALSDADEEADA